MKQERLHPIRVAIVQRFFPHYRAPLFDGLAGRPEFDFSLLCHPLDAPLTDEGIAIPVQGRPYVKAAPLFRLPRPLRAVMLQRGTLFASLFGRYDLVVVEGQISILTNIAIVALRRMSRRRTAIWHKGYFRASDMSGLGGWARRRWLRSADHVFCYGESTRTQLLGIGIPSGRLTVLYNTVDIDHALGRDIDDRPGSAAGELTVLYLGRLSRAKRVDLLLEAFLRSAARHPDIRLDIAGEGPERPSLEERARASAFGDRISFHGYVSEETAHDLFSRADICAFPGAVGLSVNEAMACGAAVLVADEPGPDSEAVVHGVSGRRVRTPTVEAWAEELEALIADAPRRASLGRAAQAQMRHGGRIEHMVERFARGIHEVVAGRDPDPRLSTQAGQHQL